MKEVYLGIGANLGDPVATIKEVIELLRKDPAVGQLVCSRLYKTSPVSDIAQPEYINAVCRLQTPLSVPELVDWLQKIEKRFGKIVVQKNGPRTIDIDILLYDSCLMSQDSIQIPHPRMLDRLFVLEPLADLTEEILIPHQQGCVRLRVRDRIQELYAICRDTVVCLEEEKL